MIKFIHLIPFYPLIQIIRVQINYGVISRTKWTLMLLWLIKLTIIEPFRILEALVMALIPEKKIKPIFIIGYYRSGTTYLQELLAADKNHRTLTLFQSVLPEISLCFDWLFIPILTIVTKVFKIENKYHHIPFDWNFPGEEDVAINAMGAVHDYNKIFQFPSTYVETTDNYLFFKNTIAANNWRRNYLYLINKIAYKYPDKTLILKSPPNTGRIHWLKETFPEARFIFIHRDPYQCIEASKHLWKLNGAFSFEEFDDSMVEKILQFQFLSFYRLLKAQSTDTLISTITFQELVEKTLGTMELVYNLLGLTNFEEAKPKIMTIEKLRKRNNVQNKSQKTPDYLINNWLIGDIRRELGYIDSN